jgi:hypothetical protein
MPLAFHEIRTVKQGRDVHQAPPYLYRIDIDDQAATADLLARHIYAVVDRAGDDRRNAHLYELRVHKVDGRQQGYGEPVFRFALPVTLP